jgi:hypothetical protein
LSPTEAAALILAAIFVVEVIVIVILQQYRAREYKRAEWEQPKLLPRERLLFGTALFVVGAILIRRALNLSVTDELWWILVTGIPFPLALGKWIRDEVRLGR